MLQFPQLGKKLEKYESVHGVIPLRTGWVWQNELPLRATVTLYEHGLLLQDQKLGLIPILYKEAKAIRFHAVRLATLTPQ